MGINIDDLNDGQKQYAKLIGHEAIKVGINPDLAIAQAFQESTLNHFEDAEKKKPLKSESNAYGLMQITPDAANYYKVEGDYQNDPIANVRGGISIMKNLLEKYGSADLALLAYHQGEPAIDRYLASKNLKEFGPKGKDYLKKIGANFDLTQNPYYEEAPTQAEQMIKEGKAQDIFPPHPEDKGALVKAGEFIADEFNKSPEATGAALGTGAGALSMAVQKHMNKQAPERVAPSSPINLNEEFKASRVEPLSAGDKWSGKVVGEMGPGGEGVTEAARNYRMQQALSPTEAAKFKVGRSGIIEPNTFERVSKVMESESPTSRVLNAGKSATRAVGNFGRTYPLSNLLSGVGAGINAGITRERLEEGDPLGAAVSGFNTAAGTAATLPTTANPYALGIKGAGMIGEVLGLPAEYLYEKYREKHPLPSVVKEYAKKHK